MKNRYLKSLFFKCIFFLFFIFGGIFSNFIIVKSAYIVNSTNVTYSNSVLTEKTAQNSIDEFYTNYYSTNAFANQIKKGKTALLYGEKITGTYNALNGIPASSDRVSESAGKTYDFTLDSTTPKRYFLWRYTRKSDPTLEYQGIGFIDLSTGEGYEYTGGGGINHSLAPVTAIACTIIPSTGEVICPETDNRESLPRSISLRAYGSSYAYYIYYAFY